MTTHLLEGLNEAQREAVEAIQGPLLIIAGPGSGKTRVITHRIAYLVRTVGVSPHRILAVTFTNKAAKEMKDRLQRLVGTQANDLTVGTFHAFSASVLRRHGQHVGLESGFSIFDDEDQMELIKAAMEEAEVDHKQFPRRSIQGVISRAKSVLLDAQGLAMQQRSYFEEVSARVYARYEELLAQNNAVDFDDLLLKTVFLFRNTPEVLRRYQERYVHLLVDEFQDTNVVQYTLAKLLADNYRNICVVGDPDQSIYSWRSADIRNILNFQKDYTDAKTVTLDVNYRSTGTILDAAKGVIAANRHRLAKDIRTSREEGSPLIVHEAFTEAEEAQYVIQQIDRLVRDDGIKRSDCAVMYRVNAQSRALEEACLRHGMPYRLIGGVRFYQRREVKDVIAYLRLISNPEDQVSLTRIINKPPRGIGQRSVDQLVHWARSQNIPLHSALELVCEDRTEDKPASHPLAPRAAQAVFGFVTLMRNLREESGRLDAVDLIDALLDRTGYQAYLRSSPDDWEERWENVLELRSAAGEFRDLGHSEGLTTLLEQVALVADVDSYDEATDAITLITLHQAKGLEFPVVFITGMEEGLLPHIRSMDSPEELEEERRLCYVGITRCMDRLFLTRAFRRGIRGSSGPTIPSRFLQEVPPHLIKSAKPIGQKRTVWSTSKAPTLEREEETVPVFKTGDKVSHATFGEGLVVSYAGRGQDSEVTVAFSGGAGVKRLMVSYAPLEKVEG
ncbi:MAG: UvrD-helicase domain-containing protein [Chloroflexi bacterium]|nr:UvrD-helicase domain-containing protein [Chloroflexota bacterium]